MANDRTLELKIAKVDEKGWDYMLRPVSEAQSAVLVDAAYVKAHAPQPGGTYIRFANGSEGYAPPGAVELPPPAASAEPLLIDDPQPGDVLSAGTFTALELRDTDDREP